MAKVAEHGASFTDGKLELEDGSISRLDKIIAACSASVTSIWILGGAVWRDHHIQKLQKFPNVAELEINGCEKLTDEAILNISKIASLTTLRLHGLCGAITPRGCKFLARLGKLELLELPLGMMSDAAASGNYKQLLNEMMRAFPNAIVQ
jgi:hypothetical protein